MDLRVRVLAFIDDGQTYQDAVDTFRVSYSTVRDWVALRDEKGQPTPRPHGGGFPPKFKPEHLVLLRKLQDENSDAPYQELVEKLVAEGGPSVTPGTIGKRLRQMGYTRKKNAASRRARHAGGPGRA